MGQYIFLDDCSFATNTRRISYWEVHHFGAPHFYPFCIGNQRNYRGCG